MGTELVVERRGKDGSIHLKEEKRNVLLINIAVNGEVVKDRSGDYRVASANSNLDMLKKKKEERKKFSIISVLTEQRTHARKAENGSEF